MQPSGRTLPRHNGEPSDSASSTTDPFIGRATEAAQLKRLLGSVKSGHGGLVTVAGEAGIGKTTLLERLARDATATGLTVAWASCWQGPDRPSFWPWVQLLRALDPSAASLLETPGGESRARLFDDVVASLRQLSSDTAIVLIIDDLHWADAASVRLLIHAARCLRSAAVLLAAAYRDSEVVPRQSSERAGRRLLASRPHRSDRAVDDRGRSADGHGRRRPRGRRAGAPAPDRRQSVVRAGAASVVDRRGSARQPEPGAGDPRGNADMLTKTQLGACGRLRGEPPDGLPSWVSASTCRRRPG